MRLAAATATVSAQGYPTRSINVVVPFPAGGPSDVVARIVTDMGRTLGQQLVIENVGGAGGTLGSARVAAAAPDGYTLLAGSMGSHVAAPVLTPNLKYDPPRTSSRSASPRIRRRWSRRARTFPPRTWPSSSPERNGDKVEAGAGGIGASSHMACLLFNAELGLKPTMVAYRGTGPAVNDLVGGVDFLCEQSVSVAEQIKAAVKAGSASSAWRRCPMSRPPRRPGSNTT